MVLKWVPNTHVLFSRGDESRRRPGFSSPSGLDQLSRAFFCLGVLIWRRQCSNSMENNLNFPWRLLHSHAYLMVHQSNIGTVADWIIDTKEVWKYSACIKMNSLIKTTGLLFIQEWVSSTVKGFHFLTLSKQLLIKKSNQAQSSVICYPHHNNTCLNLFLQEAICRRISGWSNSPSARKQTILSALC